MTFFNLYKSDALYFLLSDPRDTIDFTR